MFFLIQFGINLHVFVLQKAKLKLHLKKWLMQILTLWKIHSSKLIPKLNSKPYDYLY